VFTLAFILNALNKASLLADDQSDLVLGQADTVKISGTCIDSRQVKPSCLFVALVGEHVDGHDYVKAAFKQGACVALVEREVELNEAVEGICLKVKSCEKALVAIAKAYRHHFSGKLIALTGSAGKTSTKEILQAILSSSGRSQATQGNFNNELGVPLTLLNMQADYDYSIVEMGAAQIGDIAYLMDIAAADITLITNIGNAHVGRFGSVANIAKAKSEIYQCLADDGVAVINLDDAYAQDFIDLTVDKKQFAYTLSAHGLDKAVNPALSVLAIDKDLKAMQSRLKLSVLSEEVELTLPFIADHQVQNFIAATCCAIAAGADLSKLDEVARTLVSAKHRQEIISLDNGLSIIDDCYNANPQAMQLAIDLLADIAGDERRRVMVLGAMGELGEQSPLLHEQVGEYAAKQKIAKLIVVGDEAAVCVDAYHGVNNAKNENNEAHFYHSAEDAKAFVLDECKSGDVVLVKGSRSQQLEIIVEALIQNNNNLQGESSACC